MVIFSRLFQRPRHSTAPTGADVSRLTNWNFAAITEPGIDSVDLL